jgi:hypothetical protein
MKTLEIELSDALAARLPSSKDTAPTLVSLKGNWESRRSILRLGGLVLLAALPLTGCNSLENRCPRTDAKMGTKFP